MTSVVGTPSRHRAVVEGTFSRSLLAAAVRGLGLVAAAVVIGVVLLEVTEDSAPPDTVSVGTGTTSTTTTTIPGIGGEGALASPSEVAVLVLNAARIEGAATDVAERLQAIGHPTLDPGNAPTEEQTVVFYKPGFEEEADAVAAEVGEMAIVEPLPQPPPFAGTENADVVVQLGTDFRVGPVE